MANLGLIPSWQFNMNPAENPQVVDLTFPGGTYQTTVQPIGPYYGGGSLSGLGGSDYDDLLDAPGDLTADQWATAHNLMRKTWWWRRRKLVMVGLGTALVLGTIGGLNTIFARG